MKKALTLEPGWMAGRNCDIYRCTAATAFILHSEHGIALWLCKEHADALRQSVALAYLQETVLAKEGE